MRPWETAWTPQLAQVHGRTSPTPGSRAHQNLMSGPICRMPYLLSSLEHRWSGVPAPGRHPHRTARGPPPRSQLQRPRNHLQKTTWMRGLALRALKLRGEDRGRRHQRAWAHTTGVTSAACRSAALIAGCLASSWCCRIRGQCTRGSRSTRRPRVSCEATSRRSSPLVGCLARSCTTTSRASCLSAILTISDFIPPSWTSQVTTTSHPSPARRTVRMREAASSGQFSICGTRSLRRASPPKSSGSTQTCWRGSTASRTLALALGLAIATVRPLELLSSMRRPACCRSPSIYFRASSSRWSGLRRHPSSDSISTTTPSLTRTSGSRSRSSPTIAISDCSWGTGPCFPRSPSMSSTVQFSMSRKEIATHVAERPCTARGFVRKPARARRCDSVEPETRFAARPARRAPFVARRASFDPSFDPTLESVGVHPRHQRASISPRKDRKHASASRSSLDSGSRGRRFKSFHPDFSSPLRGYDQR